MAAQSSEIDWQPRLGEQFLFAGKRFDLAKAKGLIKATPRAVEMRPLSQFKAMYYEAVKIDWDKAEKTDTAIPVIVATEDGKVRADRRLASVRESPADAIDGNSVRGADGRRDQTDPGMSGSAPRKVRANSAVPSSQNAGQPWNLVQVKHLFDKFTGMYRLPFIERKSQMPIGIDLHRVPFGKFAVEDARGQRVFDLLLDQALQRTGAEGGIVAAFGKLGLGGISNRQMKTAAFEAQLKIAQLDVDDVLEVLLSQRVEDDDFIHAVEELRPEMLAEQRTDLGFDFPIGASFGVATL